MRTVDAVVDLKLRARSLPHEERQRALAERREVDLHSLLKTLFSRMDPDSLVEVTHGATEYGKDLVVYRKGPISTDILAVVVKSGDIRAKTAGDVDDLVKRVTASLTARSRLALSEVESQVRQARLHNAELATVFARLPVTRVVVVIAGRINKQARARLERELPDGPVEVMDLNWLVESFSEYYPDVFFDENAISFFSMKIQELETRHAFAGKFNTLVLSDYFTSPFLRPVREYPSNEAESFAQRLSEILEHRKTDLAALERELERRRRVILVGDPGVGKSGLVAKLAIDIYRSRAEDLMRRRSDSALTFPVVVPATALFDAESAESLISEYIGRASEGFPRYQVSHLFVDGVDEVAAGDRESAVSRAIEFAETLDCSLVLTSRKVDTFEVGYKDFDTFEVLPFEMGQAMQYLARLLEGNGSALEVLRQDLEELSVRYPLNPLTLRMLVALVEESKEVPAALTELYERFFDVSLGRHDMDNGVAVLFDYQVKGKALAALAFEEFFLKRRLEVPRAEFDRFMAIHGTGNIVGWNEHRETELVAELDRSGALRCTPHTVQFRHKTYLDYFAARYISDYRDEMPNHLQVLTSAHFDLAWGDVCFFYVGTLRRLPENLLKEILGFPESVDALKVSIRKVLVGRLLQAGWSSPATVRADGVVGAFNALPSVRSGFIDTMEEVGTPVPAMFADMLVLWLSQFAFGSASLADDVKKVLNQLEAEMESVDLVGFVSVAHGVQRFLTTDEVDHYAELVVGEVGRRKDARSIDRSEEIRALVMAGQLVGQDTDLARSVKRKLKRITRSAPEVAKSLVPGRRKT